MLSVIIPAWQAATTVRQTIMSVQSSTLVHEVIVVDSGSPDGTAKIAESAGARVIASPKGRGTQLAVGANAATTTWLLFIHADTILEPGWDREIIEFTARPGSDRCIGAFRFSLDDGDWRARIVERLVALRCRLFALPYGDQGLLVHRDLYHTLGGFKSIPLFEDVDLVRRAGRRRLALFGSRAITSAIRYQRNGYIGRPIRNMIYLTLYYLGVPPHIIGRIY